MVLYIIKSLVLTKLLCCVRRVMAWMKLILLVTIVLCYSLKAETAGLECPANQIRLINPDDVENSYVEYQDSENTFEILLSLNNDDFFTSPISHLPNKGNFTFNKTLLLLGFTTQGNQDSYVSEFCISYSNSSENSYQNYTQIFQVNSEDQKTFFFKESILAKKIQLFIRNGIVGVTDPSYYWQLNLFGCEEDNAVVVPDQMENCFTQPCDSQTSSPVSHPVTVFGTITSVSTVTTCAVTKSTVTTTSTVTIIVSTSTVATTVTTSTVTASAATVGAVTTSTLTTSIVTTTIVSTSVMESPVQFADQKSDNCQKELTAAIVVPVIIILIFLILSVTILIAVHITWKGKCKRSGTLKKVSNNVSYLRNNDAIEEEMIYNEIYQRNSNIQVQTSIQQFENSENLQSPIYSLPSTAPFLQDESTFSEPNPYLVPVSCNNQYEYIDSSEIHITTDQSTNDH